MQPTRGSLTVARGTAERVSAKHSMTSSPATRRARRGAYVGLGLGLVALVAVVVGLPAPAGAQEAAVAAPVVPPIDLHGFVSEGGFVSTANNYIGESARGSLEFFEAGVNVSTEIAPRLRAGLQVFTRAQGSLRDEALRLDWAFLDYRWRPWLGFRAGVVRMPFGLYNEYSDIDSARLAILLPQSIYPVRNREALLAHTGLSLYGGIPLGAAGGLEYNAWLGTLNVPADALELNGASLHDVDTRYVTGAQVFWQPPVEGLRLGATFVRASIDFNLVIDPDQVAALVAAGLVPPDYDGRLTIVQRPAQFWILSAELAHEDWLFAAEYSRATKHQRTTLPDLLPTINEDAEHLYAMVTYRLTPRLDSGVYYSLSHPDASDRDGSDARFAEHFYAFQRDLAAMVRFDVNDHWLWKAEAHFIDGTADLLSAPNPDPTRYWGLFLVRTTVTF
jgi:hypothetical protein